METKRLREVTLNLNGIFSAFDSVDDIPWKNVVSGTILDRDYYLNQSGYKYCSPLTEYYITDGVINAVNYAQLAEIISELYLTKWVKLWQTMSFEYNPINNYDMTESETVVDDGETELKRTGTDTTNRTDTDNRTIARGIYGFNSSNESNADRTTDNNTNTVQDTLTHNTTDKGTNTNERTRTLTRSGNIGVTTSQQMIQSERDLWMWDYFRIVVFPDVDRELTLKIY